MTAEGVFLFKEVFHVEETEQGKAEPLEEKVEQKKEAPRVTGEDMKKAQKAQMDKEEFDWETVWRAKMRMNKSKGKGKGRFTGGADFNQRCTRSSPSSSSSRSRKRRKRRRSRSRSRDKR